MTGTIKYYNDEKGYGFIAPDDGSKDMFVHITACPDDVDSLLEGQRVRYEERASKRTGKPEAHEVSIIG